MIPRSRRLPPSLTLVVAAASATLATLGACAHAREAAPERAVVGPPSGALVVVGGGVLGPEITGRFLELAGGPGAPIVVIPTAIGDSAYPADWRGLAVLRNAGATRLTVLHTTDTAVANSEAFARPIREARGVWFPGGRQWRLADAYLGTRTERELHALLARGGVIGGTSAGASIQASYMVRGAPEGNETMMAPGHERGFAFLRGVAVDQHVLARKRLADLPTVLAVHPELLGIGIDEGTAIVVQGDRFDVVGRSKVFVYGGRDRADAEGPYASLASGDRYDLRTRRALRDDGPRFEVPSTQGTRWIKGNTHSHTTMSDGDSPPEVVARWYKTHGYQFLVLSDHNVFTDPKTLAGLTDSSFLLIPGEELTTAWQQRAVHVNGLNIPGAIAPRTDSTLVGTIQKNVDAIREVNGVPHINHPNFRWSFDHRTLAQIRNDKLLEIFNGHPLVHNAGGGGSPGLEEMWDHLLTGGQRIYGIAVDDAHHFQGEFAPERSNPGRGWVVVRSASLEAGAIMRAMEAGQFYASSGVALDDIVVEPRRLTIRIRQQGDFKYRTEFIGSEGKILARTTANPAVFALPRGEPYVRAKVYDSGGAAAWVQPVWVVK
ncbi:MAG: CehA/McbA family metallohydrolase [Gemmatimonadaceae bacterium]